jgi:hypothetical protein
VKDIDKKNLLEYIENKWGDTNILAWDLGRAVYLAAACHGAGYITFDEYVNLSLPAVRILQKSFNNWPDYTANRLDGFKYWVSGRDAGSREKAVGSREKSGELLLGICKGTGFRFDQELNIRERDALKLEDIADLFKYHVTLQLNARLQPFDRHYFFEDRLEEELAKYDCGIVDGGGTLQGQSGEVENCDVEIDLVENSKETMKKLLSAIDEVGVPKGSFLLSDEGHLLPVGRLEGLALYLNGTELPDEVYKNCNINYVVEELNSLLDSSGHIYSYWSGPQDTALYFYGDSFDERREKMENFLAKYPLCQKCRVEKIA